jgi:hypothetical protein
MSQSELDICTDICTEAPGQHERPLHRACRSSTKEKMSYSSHLWCCGPCSCSCLDKGDHRRDRRRDHWWQREVARGGKWWQTRKSVGFEMDNLRLDLSGFKPVQCEVFLEPDPPVHGRANRHKLGQRRAFLVRHNQHQDTCFKYLCCHGVSVYTVCGTEALRGCHALRWLVHIIFRYAVLD